MCALAVGCIAVLVPASFGQVSVSPGQIKVLVDQVGYETTSPKQALILAGREDHPDKFFLVDASTGKSVLSGALKPAGKVDAWEGTYLTADFSSWRTKGHYADRKSVV